MERFKGNFIISENALQSLVLYAKISKMAKANPAKFLKEVKVELSRVIWPTRAEAIKLTLVVILVSALIGAFISAIDFVLTKVMAGIIR